MNAQTPIQSCPCCGAPIAAGDARMLFAPETGVIVRAGQVAALTRAESSIVEALLDAGIRGCTKERLLKVSSMDVTGDDERDLKIVDVFICKLRKKLKPLDIPVETLWGRGYRIQPNALGGVNERD